MIREAVILAGGLGTRLRPVVNELPKVMAPVNGKPFLHYIITTLEQQGITSVVLAVGYLKESIMAWCDGRYPNLSIYFAIENSPLGTGGAIANALHHCSNDEVLLLNGDTYFELNYQEFFNFHQNHGSICSLALKPMQDFDRYGCVVTDAQHHITSFLEKSYRENGLINAGVYLLDRKYFMSQPWPEVFSFEKDFLEKKVDNNQLSGFVANGYFIDIGIPSDYEKAQTDFKLLFPS